MADVWYVGVDQVPESLAVLLDERDRARHRRIAVPADRRRSLAAWVLARLVLGAELGRDPASLRFDRTCAHCDDPAHGKPVVETSGPRPDFSLAHSGSLAVLAVADRAVGVDVEDATAREQPLVAALSARERASCRTYADFARLWTRKEAVLKAVGKGLAVHPRHVEVHGTTLLALPAALGRPADYTLRDLPLPAPYVGSVAARGSRLSWSVRSGESLVRRAARLCQERPVPAVPAGTAGPE
ncbi:4'-phosphopantetheinyl transferase superfamily protein [Streptomyces sp. JB150]|uniref:4'-phosphopantetheinyl transferase family protein n=1 Tax=Streptomyces sp. JB150 TaxID=2714844 RepID=UPI00140BDB11|nr:4'-phosphopantetheinyl transferase superfamily protein [Streptomyces sp. JB150]QIJ64512.1 4'-phosphopantetheinyl transferase superfamily protein [Streptomyces sp. JB150]